MAPLSIRQRLVAWPRDLGRFLLYSGRRFLADECPARAASLSYTSLLALVPLLAIAIAMLSAFDVFEELRLGLQSWVFQSLLPEAALTISDHVTTFVDNASRLTGPGVLGLAVTALLLLNTINSALNGVWHISESRSLAVRILIFWALLTLGPLLLGASLSLSGYAFAVVRWSGVETYAASLIGLAWLLPILLSTAGFTLLFLIVPNRAVGLGQALTGAVVAAVLFELLKKGFGLYLGHFPSYQAVYGALSAVPIFLVWMYLSWAVVLFGAEIAAALPEWRSAPPPGRGRTGAGASARLALALALLGRLKAAWRSGKPMHEGALARGLPVTLRDLDEVLMALRAAGFAIRSPGNRWTLARDLGAATLGELLEALGLSLRPDAHWPDSVQAGIAALGEASSLVTGRSLDEFLVEETAPPRPRLRLGRLA